MALNLRQDQSFASLQEDPAFKQLFVIIGLPPIK
jgi:hypothetical protein